MPFFPSAHLGHSWQVYQGEAEHLVGVVLEGDGLRADALVVAGHAVRLALDLRADVVLLRVDLVLGVQELGPLVQVHRALLGGPGEGTKVNLGEKRSQFRERINTTSNLPEKNIDKY